MRGKKIGGFTIVELMTVIAIVGVLLSLATISMAGYMSRTKLRTTLYAIDADIRQARWIAQCTVKTCFIKFDTSTNSYTSNGTQYTKFPEGVRFGVAPGVTGCPGAPTTSAPIDGISFDSHAHPNTLNYYPTGAVVPAGTVYITDGKESMAVRVARTGRPKLWQSSGGSKWAAL